MVPARHWVELEESRLEMRQTPPPGCGARGVLEHFGCCRAVGAPTPWEVHNTWRSQTSWDIIFLNPDTDDQHGIRLFSLELFESHVKPDSASVLSVLIQEDALVCWESAAFAGHIMDIQHWGWRAVVTCGAEYWWAAKWLWVKQLPINNGDNFTNNHSWNTVVNDGTPGVQWCARF